MICKSSLEATLYPDVVTIGGGLSIEASLIVGIVDKK
jgi:hypothetical protein